MAVSHTGFYTGKGSTAWTVRIQGLDEIKRKLYQLSEIGQTKAADQSLREGAKVIRDSIKAKTPVAEAATKRRGITYSPGSLKRSITIKKGKSEKGIIRYQVGPDKKIAYYGHMVEFGTSRHKIKAKKGKFLKFRRTSGGKYRPQFISEQTYIESLSGGKVGGGYVFIPEVWVKARPHPYMRPGFDAGKFKAVEAIKQKLRIAINRIAEGRKGGWESGAMGIAGPGEKFEFT